MRLRAIRFLIVAAAAALALAAPISRARAATPLFAFPRAVFPATLSALPPTQQGWVGGMVFSMPITGNTGVSSCGANTPALIGPTGGTATQTCALLAFVGPSIGQINSQVGPTIIGSVILAPVTVSGGAVVNTVP